MKRFTLSIPIVIKKATKIIGKPIMIEYIGNNKYNIEIKGYPIHNIKFNEDINCEADRVWTNNETYHLFDIIVNKIYSIVYEGN